MARATNPKHPPLSPVLRTIRFPAKLWHAVKLKGKAEQKPVRRVLDEAAAAQMPPLIERLRNLGVCGERKADKRVRVPMSDDLLSCMRFGREQTGLPGILLLTLCLQCHTAKSNKRIRRRTAHE